MSENSRRRVATSLLAGLSANAVVLTGYSSDVEGDINAEMDNAMSIPAASPTAPDTATGKVRKIDEGTADVVFVGDRVALEVGDKILAGPLNNSIERSMKLDTKCGELAPDGSNAPLSCEDGIHAITDQVTETAVVGCGTNYSVAVSLEGGRIIGAHADSDVVDVSGAGGESVSDLEAANNESQPVEIPEVDNNADVKLLEINRPETSVHEPKLDEFRAGSALRAGIGIDKTASGDHVIAIADTRGNQLLIYITTDIIRLHQVAPAPEVLWTVAVDESHGIAWVASTKVNKLTGYNISSGIPVKVVNISAIVDPQSIAATEDGQIGIFSATGGGVQTFDSADVDKVIADFKQDAGKIREEVSVRELTDKLSTSASDTKGIDDLEGETK